MMNSQLPFGAPQLRVLDDADAIDLDSMQRPTNVEFVTVPQFLRRFATPPKGWGFENIAKFGHFLNRVADGFGCSYQSAMDPVIGPARLFPARLVERVYPEQAPNYGWPAIPKLAPPAELAENTAEREVKQAVLKQLRMLVESHDPATKAAAQKLLDGAERELATV